MVIWSLLLCLWTPRSPPFKSTILYNFCKLNYLGFIAAEDKGWFLPVSGIKILRGIYSFFAGEQFHMAGRIQFSQLCESQDDLMGCCNEKKRWYSFQCWLICKKLPYLSYIYSAYPKTLLSFKHFLVKKWTIYCKLIITTSCPKS